MSECEGCAKAVTDPYYTVQQWPDGKWCHPHGRGRRECTVEGSQGKEAGGRCGSGSSSGTPASDVATAGEIPAPFITQQASWRRVAAVSLHDELWRRVDGHRSLEDSHVPESCPTCQTIMEWFRERGVK